MISFLPTISRLWHCLLVFMCQNMLPMCTLGQWSWVSYCVLSWQFRDQLCFSWTMLATYGVSEWVSEWKISVFMCLANQCVCSQKTGSYLHSAMLTWMELLALLSAKYEHQSGIILFSIYFVTLGFPKTTDCRLNINIFFDTQEILCFKSFPA